MPNILHRVAEHKKSLGAVLSAGLARGHRGSPAAALRVHQIHCTPVLFSGLATLVLNKAEIDILINIINIQFRTSSASMKTPRSIIFFLAGSLPGKAILHMRQLSLLSMICHLPEDPLHQHCKYAQTIEDTCGALSAEFKCYARNTCWTVVAYLFYSSLTISNSANNTL